LGAAAKPSAGPAPLSDGSDDRGGPAERSTAALIKNLGERLANANIDSGDDDLAASGREAADDPVTLASLQERFDALSENGSDDVSPEALAKQYGFDLGAVDDGDSDV
jgi:hypothetical protein